MKGSIFKVKEGKLAEWQSWCDYLKSQSGDVLETLKEEQAESETSISFQIDGCEYVAMIAIAHGTILPPTPRPINDEHRKKKRECFESLLGPISVDYHFTTLK